MAVIRVEHGIDMLAGDMRRIPAQALKKSSSAVRANTRQGRTTARALARKSSGAHGKNYWKRIDSEMLTPLSGEFGPHGDVVGNAVGAGWRNGPPNTDLPKAADVAGPKLAKDIRGVLDDLFWA